MRVNDGNAQDIEEMIARAIKPHRRRRPPPNINFGIIMPDRVTPPTVPTTWRAMNVFGVSFPPRRGRRSAGVGVWRHRSGLPAVCLP
jgi:hypothetical protein